MAKSIWNGTVTLGMLAVPIKLYSATSKREVEMAGKLVDSLAEAFDAMPTATSTEPRCSI